MTGMVSMSMEHGRMSRLITVYLIQMEMLVLRVREMDLAFTIRPLVPLKTVLQKIT